MATSEKPIWEGEWVNGDKMDGLYLRIVEADGRCLICHKEQPHDVRWPAYAVEIQPIGAPSLGDYEFHSCPAHESEVDALLLATQ